MSRVPSLPCSRGFSFWNIHIKVVSSEIFSLPVSQSLSAGFHYPPKVLYYLCIRVVPLLRQLWPSRKFFKGMHGRSLSCSLVTVDSSPCLGPLITSVLWNDASTLTHQETKEQVFFTRPKKWGVSFGFLCDLQLDWAAAGEQGGESLRAVPVPRPGEIRYREVLWGVLTRTHLLHAEGKATVRWGLGAVSSTVLVRKADTPDL